MSPQLTGLAWAMRKLPSTTRAKSKLRSHSGAGQKVSSGMQGVNIESIITAIPFCLRCIY